MSSDYSFKKGQVVYGIRSRRAYRIISAHHKYITYDNYINYYWVEILATNRKKRVYEHDLVEIQETLIEQAQSNKEADQPKAATSLNAKENTMKNYTKAELKDKVQVLTLQVVAEVAPDKALIDGLIALRNALTPGKPTLNFPPLINAWLRLFTAQPANREALLGIGGKAIQG